MIVLALPLPDRCRTAGHLATLAKRLEGKHLGLSVAVDSLDECSHATSNTSPALQLLPKSRFRDKDLVFRDKTTMMMELSALADAASSIEFTDRECYDLLRTQWESSCDQIRLVPLSECSNYSVQCLRCAWQCKARSFTTSAHCVSFRPQEISWYMIPNSSRRCVSPRTALGAVALLAHR